MLTVVHDTECSNAKNDGVGRSLLDEIVRDGARQMLAAALTAEVAAYIDAHAGEVDEHGRRPCYGAVDRLQSDPRWREDVLFFEYFHGDTGAGLGASHQTGWTALVADVIRRRHGSLPSLGALIAGLVRVDP